MRTTMAVLLALLLACPAVALAGGDQNQNQHGKEDGTPGNGEQVKERERPDDPNCPDDCPGCPGCDDPDVCEQAAFGNQASPVAVRDRDRERDRDGDGEDPVGDGEGDSPNGPNGPNGDGDGEGGDGPYGPGDCPEQD